MTRMTRRRAALGLALPVILAGPVAGLRTPGPPAVRTITVGRIPLALAVDEHTRRVFVANYGAASVTMLDAASGATLATVAVAPQPSALAVATTAGRVFAVSDDVTLDGAGRVSVLDAASGRLLRTVAMGRGDHALAVDERTGHLFVTNSGDDSVSMVDGRRGTMLRTVPVGPSPLAVAVDQPLRHAFVLKGGLWDNGNSSARSSVSLLDTRSGAVLHSVVVGRRADAIAIDARSGQAFVTNSGDATMSVLDANTGSVVRTVAVGAHPSAIVVDEHRGHVFVANIYGTPANPSSMGMLVAWSRRWLPARGQQWLSWLTLPSHPSRVVASSVSVLDVARS